MTEIWTNDAGESVELAEGEAFIYGWQKQLHGGFKKALAEAMARADPGNLLRLETAFPEEARAMREWKLGDLHQRLKAKGFSL